MDKLEILVICRHPEILQTVIRLVNNNPEWNATGSETDEDAIAVFNSNSCKLVLLGAGVNAASEEKLKQIILLQNPDTLFVQHYGGGSGLLTAEIYEALAGRNQNIKR